MPTRRWTRNKRPGRRIQCPAVMLIVSAIPQAARYTSSKASGSGMILAGRGSPHRFEPPPA